MPGMDRLGGEHFPPSNGIGELLSRLEMVAPIRVPPMYIPDTPIEDDENKAAAYIMDPGAGSATDRLIWPYQKPGYETEVKLRCGSFTPLYAKKPRIMYSNKLWKELEELSIEAGKLSSGDLLVNEQAYDLLKQMKRMIDSLGIQLLREARYEI